RRAESRRVGPIVKHAVRQRGQQTLKFVVEATLPVAEQHIKSHHLEHGVEQIIAKLWIYGCAGDDQIGYLLISEKLPNSCTSETELYQAGVRKERRGEGHGRKMVQLFVALAPPNMTLY